MPRAIFNDGQEVIQGDFNRLQKLREKEMLERVLLQLLDEGSDRFFDDAFFVEFVDGTNVSVRPGLGMQLDSSQVDPDSKQRLIALDASKNVALAAPDGSNDRIDIITVKSSRTTPTTDSRNVKSSVDGQVLITTIDVQDDWSATLSKVTGTPSGSPVAPSTPAGELKIAEVLVTAVSGVANQAAITDTRDLVRKRYVDVLEQAGAGSLQNPSANLRRLWSDTSGNLFLRDDQGVDSVIGGASGGSGSIAWRAEEAPAPVVSVENSEVVFLYDKGTSGEIQKAHLFLKIPTSYVPGRQIKLKGGFYSPSTSNVGVFDTTATLVRAASDAIDSVVNQATDSANLTATSPANLLQVLEFNLTDSSGEINGVAASAGDIIKIELSRDVDDGSDTDTAGIRFIPNYTEVSF